MKDPPQQKAHFQGFCQTTDVVMSLCPKPDEILKVQSCAELTPVISVGLDRNKDGIALQVSSTVTDIIILTAVAVIVF